MTHHPHIDMIVPGGGISLDGRRWISSRPAFLLPVRVLGALFRRLFLTQLIELYEAGRLAFFGTQVGPADRRLFLRRLTAVRKKRFVVLAAQAAVRRPPGRAAYLARYTHRLAISNRRLIAFDETGVTFRYKDYRRDGAERQRVMTLAPHEFIRRFLLHVLPRGFHRIRHYGLLASSARKVSVARARELLGVAPSPEPMDLGDPLDHLPPCPRRGGRMSSSRPSSDGGNPARHLTQLHQPGASPRDPARLALISCRNTAVAANAPIHALRHDQPDRTEYEPWPTPDPRAAGRKLSRNKSPPTPAPSRFRRHHS